MNPYLFFRKSRSPGKRASRSPSRSPGRPRGGGSSPFGSDENDRVNNNDFLQQNQKSALREREEEKRRLQAEMRRREQELLAKIKEQQRELETMKQEKGKVYYEINTVYYFALQNHIATITRNPTLLPKNSSSQRSNHPFLLFWSL